jgi:hypothetical protein
MSKVTLKFATLAAAIATLSGTLAGQNEPAPVIGMQKVAPSEFNGDVRVLPKLVAAFGLFADHNGV